MKHLFVLWLLTVTCVLGNESKECEIATIEATRIHWQWVEGKATIHDSYNATARMNKICKEENK